MFEPPDEVVPEEDPPEDDPPDDEPPDEEPLDDDELEEVLSDPPVQPMTTESARNPNAATGAMRFIPRS